MELHDLLKPREIEILRLMADGLTNREIGERLYIGFETVKWYAKQIYSKLDVSSREDASEKAQELGLLDNEQPSDIPQPLIRPKHNLPTQLTSFIGRKTQIETIKNLLIDTRLLTLTGPGGTGKTRLSIRVAEDLIDDFADGVYFVDLAPIDNSENIPKAIATALAVLENTDESLVDTLKRSIGERHVLLVIDNFEHVMGGASIVSDLLTGTVNLKVIVTSREALRLIGEQEYPIPPLDLGEQDSEAVTLFVQRAQLVRPSFRLDDSNKDDIVSICQRVDGLPLAIELAAARCKLLTPQALLKRLDNRLTSLTGGSRDAPQRQQTLQATIDWSYDLLDDDEKMLFARLAVFCCESSLEGIEAICGNNLSMDVFDGLASLVDKSMVRQVEDKLGEPRFVMLETIQEYAWQRLQERNEFDILQGRHATYYMELAERAAPELRLKHQEYWFTKLDIEQDNIRSAMAWALSGKAAEIGLRTVASLRDYWWYQGSQREGWRWIDHALEFLDDVPPKAQADLLLAACILSYFRHDFTRCTRFANDAIELYKKGNDQRGVAWAYMMLGNPINDSRTRYYRDALTIMRDINDLPGQALLLNGLGMILFYNEQNYEDAEKVLRECIQISRQTGEVRRETLVIDVLGHIAFAQEHIDRARQYYMDSAKLSKDLPFSFGMLEALRGCMLILCKYDKFDPALIILGAIKTYEQLTGQLVHPNEKRFFDVYVQKLLAMVDQSPVHQAQYEAGSRMSLEEAVEFVLTALSESA